MGSVLCGTPRCEAPSAFQGSGATAAVLKCLGHSTDACPWMHKPPLHVVCPTAVDALHPSDGALQQGV